MTSSSRESLCRWISAVRTVDDVPDDAADYLKRKEQKELEQQEATQKDEKNPK